MQKILIVLAGLVMTTMLLTGCNEKLVSETCIFCGAPATKNYTNPQSIDMKLSRNNEKNTAVESAFELKAGQTVALCDKCYGLLELMVGQEK